MGPVATIYAAAGFSAVDLEAQFRGRIPPSRFTLKSNGPVEPPHNEDYSTAQWTTGVRQAGPHEKFHDTGPLIIDLVSDDPPPDIYDSTQLPIVEDGDATVDILHPPFDPW